ncbi:MAG: hypothetical protein HYU51_04310 [Candidatus Rokubacteria bacterium]|nr:hypothetical protein [Candidatus Rokubacteria bacterium]
MHRFLGISILAGLGLVLIAGPAAAKQCPKLVAQVNAQVGNRFDATAANARQTAAQAEQLHKAGKHADSEKLATETLEALGKKKM